ncbi:MAG: response regulator transcription factor [Verrucomicrobiales bacterium]
MDEAFMLALQKVDRLPRLRQAVESHFKNTLKISGVDLSLAWEEVGRPASEERPGLPLDLLEDSRFVIGRLSDWLSRPGNGRIERTVAESSREALPFTLAMVFRSSAGKYLGQLRLVREAPEGDFEDVELQRLAVYQAHLNAVVRRLEQNVLRDSLWQALRLSVSSLPLALVLLDTKGKICFYTRAGKEALARWKLGAAWTGLEVSPRPSLPPDLKLLLAPVLAHCHRPPREKKTRERTTVAHFQHPELTNLSVHYRLIVPHSASCGYPPALLLEFRSQRVTGWDGDSPRRLLSLLTEREGRVAELVALGRENQEIARTLGISLSTVKTHLRHIYEKLGIHSRGELMRVMLA